MANFGERMKTARLAAKLSQERLGIEAGIEEADSARARINRYERGTRVPALETVERIAKVLDVPVTYFYSQNEDEANLLLAFHRMTSENRKQLLDAILSKRP